MAGKIFINYRRGDDPGNTGRLFDRLQEAFQPEQLFMDVDSIAPGLDFVRVLEEQVGQCDALLAVIGKAWIDARDDTGARRLDNPQDFVRIEIESALKQDKRVIPVLVGDTHMPRPEELPEAIRPLARRNAVRLSHERFRADAQGLIKALQRALEEVEALRQANAEVARRAQAEEERKREEAAATARAQAQREAEEQARRDKEQARLNAIAGLSPDQITKAEELANWDFIKASENAQEYRDHLARFPGGVTERFALARLEHLVWAGLGASPSLDELCDFLAEFPQGRHAKTAADRRAVMEQKRADAEEAKAATARAQAQREAEEQARRDKEQARLNAIAGLSPDQITKAEELANWDFIKASENAQEYRDHLARFPGGVKSQQYADEQQDGYDADQYYEDEASLDPHDEEMYDDPPPARGRSGLTTALALVGCALLVTVAAYAYRSYTGPAGSMQPPPVITADNSTPTKIVPATAGNPQSGKAVAVNAGKEQPAPQPVPRVTAPPPVAAAPSTAPAPQPPAAAATASGEPKKVRTVTIRPDGSDASARPIGEAPPAAPSVAAAPSRPAADAASSASGGYVVQLSSQTSESEALSSFRSLQAKFPNELGGRQPIIRRADLGSKGVFYRTLVGPFASADDAHQFCSSYKAAGGQCVVPNN